jgi:putative ABC transport system substrate-binding protein
VRRRTFLAFTATMATAWPLAARSQQMIRLIGFLGGADPVGYAVPIEALRAGLRDHGYVEGENFRSSIDGRRVDTIGSLRSRRT